MTQIFVKDPDEILDYSFNWTYYLAAGETIVSYTLSVDAGITKLSDNELDGIITFWLSGGIADEDYNIVCLIETSVTDDLGNPRTEEAVIIIQVRDSTSINVLPEPEYDESPMDWDEVSALSIYRYAQILGINPVHLSTSGNIELSNGSLLFPLDGTGRYYQQRSYFLSDHVSREEIISEIYRAEAEIEDFLGTFVAPKWSLGEPLDLINHYDPLVGYNVYNVRGERVRYLPMWGKFIAGGVPASVLLERETDVTYSDPDGDGFDELATVQFEIYDSDISLYEIKVFFACCNGSSRYEIRPPLRKSISGNTVTIEFESWKLLDPDLYERYPTDDTNRIIDMTDADNFVTQVDVYRKYNDTTTNHAVFYYVSSDNDFEDSEQGGYIKLSDPNLNTIQIIPANYNSDTEEWERASCFIGKLRNIKINYLSGHKYRPYSGSNFWDELHPDLAQAIAYMATARLERPLAGREDVVALATALQNDLASGKSGSFRYTTNDITQNPFGTHAGEVYAWRRLMHFQHKFMRYNNR